jgi:hypothetical protein
MANVKTAVAGYDPKVSGGQREFGRVNAEVGKQGYGQGLRLYEERFA